MPDFILPDQSRLKAFPKGRRTLWRKPMAAIAIADFTCVLYEGNKDIKSTTTQLDWTATLLEKPLGDRQSKTSEEDDIVFHLNRPLIHFDFTDGTPADRSFTATVRG